MIEIFKIHVQGRVQGVGFRPFIYRVAREMDISGSVENRTDGVWIIAQCNQGKLNQLISQIKDHSPPASHITRISVKTHHISKELSGFRITPSQRIEGEITGICPDIGVCQDCLDDMQSQSNRIDYPFINCTNCGPRFSIIQSLPYDRKMTSMSIFDCCASCQSEYEDMNDRRFHAQPVACWDCGPVYYQEEPIMGKARWIRLLKKITEGLESGQILAIQGVGGYHLICDANNKNSIAELRKRKKRDGKPFAVMMKDCATIRQYCNLNDHEEQILTSWQKPIVLLSQHTVLHKLINQDLNTLGVFLPYTPLHEMLFRQTDLTALVCTSGNSSNEPIVIDPISAEKNLASIADEYIHSNRAIVNRTDDSVIRIINQKPTFIRRSRGYVPSGIPFGINPDGILALGAELKNTFCIGKANEAIMSQHIGDLKNMETLAFYEESIALFKQLYQFEPDMIACDLHPDYLSSQYAETTGLPIIGVQHHHAHMASCMAEHGLDEKVIGITWDGIGLGSDDTIWGGEFLIGDLEQFDRFRFFDPVPLPGGDRASLEPWRMAISYIDRYLGKECLNRFPALSEIPSETTDVIFELCQHNSQALTSSAGRLFDAVAALTGTCLYNTFEAEAAMRLESLTDNRILDEYPIDFQGAINFQSLFESIMEDVQNDTPLITISTRFHRSLAALIVKVCQEARSKTGIKKIVLSGGTFQNRFLTEKAIEALEKDGFLVHQHQKVSPNDGGIALGQLMVATKLKLKSTCA